MKRLWICMGFLFVFFITPILAEREPNLPEIGIEERLVLLESKIEELEERIEYLENAERTALFNPREVSNESTENPESDALRIERFKEQVQDALNAIELIKTEIANIPTYYPSQEDKLDTFKKETQLYSEMERNLLRIVNIAERYPDLDIDVMAFKKRLIRCQSNKKRAAIAQGKLREEIRKSKKYK